MTSYRNVIDQTPKKDILVLQGNWNTKVGKDAHETGKASADPPAMTKQTREGSDFGVCHL